MHNEGEEFWLVGIDFPVEMVSARLPLESGGNMALTSIHLNEKVTTQINRKTAPCALYKQSNEFIECGKKQLWSLLKPRINCTIAILRSIIPDNSEILECNSILSAGITYKIMMNIFTEFSWKISQYGCPVPCSQSSYNINLRHLHRNSWIDPDNLNVPNDFAVLAILYNSLLVEERIETIVYDLESLMTSVGGNLGLFLGFSCLSTLLAILKFLFKIRLQHCLKVEFKCMNLKN